jgi:serine/threonine protein kinase/formylglycine-generating enzyme required for sulfatase activity
MTRQNLTDRQLFEDALDLPPEQREEFIKLSGVGEAGASRVRKMLRTQELLAGQGGRLAQAMADIRVQACEPSPCPEWIGPYRVLRLLGEGNRSQVYLCEQQIEDGVKHVAVKRYQASRNASWADWKRECKALLRIQDSRIATVIDSKREADGQSYLVLEYVDGENIIAHCSEERLPLQSRLRLVMQLCEAVGYMHQKGVVHRDLSPANVMVAGDGEDASIKVVDFGLAWLNGEQRQTDIQYTGTPLYMAPEQASGQDVDTTADVYSIGAILSELLCGVPLYDDQCGGRGFPIAGIQTMPQWADYIKMTAPDLPSERLAKNRALWDSMARRMNMLRSRLRAILAHDLDWVVRKATQADPRDRYRSPLELKDDLRRYLERKPVFARPTSMAYRARKFLRQYPWQSAVALIIACFGIGAFVVGVEVQQDSKRMQKMLEVLGLADGEGDNLPELLEHMTVFDDVEKAKNEEAELWLEDLDSVGVPAKAQSLRAWLEGTCQGLIAEKQHIQESLKRIQESLKRIADKQLSVSVLQPAVKKNAKEYVTKALKASLDAVEVLESKHKPSVERRIAWVEQVLNASASLAKSTYDWPDVKAAIEKADGKVASELYAGAGIQIPDGGWIGLVPIGMNPITKLWEFYDLRSAWDGQQSVSEIVVPQHREDGSIDVSEEMGFVFVLLPGGVTWVGSQGVDEAQPNYDPNSREGEVLRQEKLGPFLIARHEVTIAQWLRLTAMETGAGNLADQASSLSPASLMSWSEAKKWAGRHGYSLPTEVQWEYSCRSDSKHPYSCGPGYASLEGFVNLLGKECRLVVGSLGSTEEFDDLWREVAPIGSYKCNGFGIWDMHGNVAEWCLPDSADSIEHSSEKGDKAIECVHRGGHYRAMAVDCRSAARCVSDVARSPGVGFRVVAVPIARD